jgi:hypothetical protein
MGGAARGKLEDFEARREFDAWISGIPRVIAYVQGHLWNVVQRGHNVVLVLLEIVRIAPGATAGRSSFTGHLKRFQEKTLSKAVARAAPRRYTAS